MDPITPPFEPIQMANYFLILWILFVQYLQYRQRQDSALWLVPMATYIIHSLIFYSFLLLEHYSFTQIDVRYTNWSGWLRWHGYVAIAIGETTRWFLKSKLFIRIFNWWLKRSARRANNAK